MLNVILATLGTAGDVHPFIPLAAALQARGHRVTLLAPLPFAPAAEEFGVTFRGIGKPGEFESALRKANRNVWHGSLAGIEPYLPAFYHAISEAHAPGRTVIAAHPLALAAPVASEKLAAPLLSVNVSPLPIRTLHDTPIFFPGQTSLALGGRPLKRLIYGFLETLIASSGALRMVNRFRGSVGARSITAREVYCFADRVLGLWPEWFAPIQADWPATTLSGFIHYNSKRSAERFVPAEDRPIVITGSTWSTHRGGFFAAAAQACQLLGRPAVIVTRESNMVPRALPPLLRHVAYAPFDQLFPCASAVIHHGGIGTAAQALAAGVPQLVRPFIGDQFDNANRLARLGVARVLRGLRCEARAIADELKQLTDNADVQKRCALLRARMDPDAALEIASHAVEAAAHSAAR